MKSRRVRFPCGQLTLEGVLHEVESPSPVPAVVICHPHPLYGGDMDNNVVVAVAMGLARDGIAALRFNFRGTGDSDGAFGGGIGEREDVSAALAFLAVQMLFIPCVAVVATIRQETGSWKWTAFSIALLLVLSFSVGIAIYQGAMLVGWGV